MLKEYFTVGASPDLKHFKLQIHDLDACADRKVQDHIYSALHKYLRSLKNRKEKDLWQPNETTKKNTSGT